MINSTRIPRPFLFLSSVAFCLALVLTAVSWRFRPTEITVELGFLILAAALSENFALSLPPYSIALSYLLTMGAIVLAGPAGASLVAMASSVTYQEIKGKKPLSYMAVNFGQLVSITTIGAWPYIFMGGRVLYAGSRSYSPLESSDFPRILIPLAVVALVCVLGNMGAAALAIRTIQDQPIRAAMAGIAWVIHSQVALAFVGYLMAQVLAINLVALPLFIAPLLVARQLYERYSYMKSAFADTVRSLVGALEAKDTYTRGHSERVSKYAARIGEALALDSRALERLEYSALLHDIGKLRVPREVLVKPGKLDAREYELIREHPATGAEMVSRIPPLRDLADLIRLHHERPDGLGYPSGITAAQVPLAAKILAVADCYDAMTTTRSYRAALSCDEAYLELALGAGGQFDSEVVCVFLAERDADLRLFAHPNDQTSAEGDWSS